MPRVVWIVTAFFALLWSALCWFLWTLAGAGSAAALGLARLLQIDPLQVAWLADILDSIGGVAQLLVVVFWIIGMAAMLLVAGMAARAARATREAITEARIMAGDPAAGHGPALEGEVRHRAVQRPDELPPG